MFAITVMPNNADAWFGKGLVVYCSAVNKKDALYFFDKVTQLDPSYTSAWVTTRKRFS
jgi:hypothetical protein